MPLRAFTAKNFPGRDRELEIFRNILSEAKSGDAAGIFLSGRNGIGKTEFLKHLFNHFFNSQNDAVPFFYTVKTAFTSVENFSKDYLCSFILQSLAFLKKNPSMTEACLYSFEDLKRLAKESGMQWAVDAVEEYSEIKNSGDPWKAFLSAVTAPCRSFLSTGMPVVVMLDDFHKIRRLCEVNPADGDKNFWTLFESAIKFRHTPHILSGYQAELNKMFFEDTSLGEYLELVDLPGLDRKASIKFFSSLCEAYGLNLRAESCGFIDLLDGNPFYIKNLAQAARQAGKAVSEDDFWHIYFNEVTRGKTFKYWTSVLKTCIPQHELRKPSLRLIYHLSESGDANLHEKISIGAEELERVITRLVASGAVETGFSELRPSEDMVLIDVIKGLYFGEIEKAPVSKIKDAIMTDKRQRIVIDRSPSFDIKIPADKKAEILAVRTLEHAAQHFNVAPEAIGRLQVALTELFINIAEGDGSDEDYHMRFKLKDNLFTAEVSVPRHDFSLSDSDNDRIKAYVDDVKVERVMTGTKITLFKELNKDAAPAS
ncbi:MAG: AAA family ATPase [Nitrospirae bacterium]|nr:AAA family ATPase [Nitrospirota bacterium]